MLPLQQPNSNVVLQTSCSLQVYPALMETLDLQEIQEGPFKGVWRFAITMIGDRCVMSYGMMLMLEWPADSWDCLAPVSIPRTSWYIAIARQEVYSGTPIKFAHPKIRTSLIIRTLLIQDKHYFFTPEIRAFRNRSQWCLHSEVLQLYYYCS